MTLRKTSKVKVFVWMLFTLAISVIGCITLLNYYTLRNLSTQHIVTHIGASYHDIDVRDVSGYGNEEQSTIPNFDGRKVQWSQFNEARSFQRDEKTLDRDLKILAIHTHGLQYYGTPEQSQRIGYSASEEQFMRKWYFNVINDTTPTEDMFKDCPGQSSRCTITTDPNKYDEADVVIIRPGYMFDDPEHLNGKKLIRAHPDQKFAFQFFENPHQWKPGMMESMNERIGFNLTIHYQTESNIWWPYGWKIPRSQPIQLPARNYASGKTRKVLFVTSHCNTMYQHREHYIAELIKYIDVDIYGKCIDDTTERDPTPVRALAKHYKFLIAFENGDCDDYITEKFFKYLMQVDNVIPIVLGRRNHYETLAPPMSYIQALQFDNARQLAAYLRVLDKNDKMFNQYFEWREKWTVQYLPKPYCDICQYMRETHYQHLETDMVKFLSLNRCVKYNRDLVVGWESKVTNYSFQQPWNVLKRLNSRGKPLRFP